MENKISIAELKDLEKAKSVLVLDVRNPDEYSESHVPGAVNIPVTELKNRLEELPTNILLVTDCGKGGGRARTAQTLHSENGRNVKWLEGGSLGYLDTLNPPNSVI